MMKKNFFLLLVLLAHAAMAMEKAFCNLTQYMHTNLSMHEIKLVEFPAQHGQQPEILPLLVSAAQLTTITTFHLGSLVVLRNKRSLFGDSLMPKYMRCFLDLNLPVDFFSSAMSTTILNIWYEHDSTQAWCVANGLNIIRTLANMIHLSNFIHQDALTLLKKSFPSQLIIKNKLDITEIPDAQCLICYESDLERDYVNPCNQSDHIFCKDCLIECFDVQKNKPSFMNGESLFCDFCRKEVPFNDKKFEYVQPKVTLKGCMQQLGAFRATLYFIGFWTMGILLQSCFS